MSSKLRLTFNCLRRFVSEDDYVSINHVLQWEYHKSEIFQITDDEGLTLIHQACLGGHLTCLDALLRHGANAHTKSSVGWTPLHAATLGGHLDIVKYLLNECSADPLAKDDMNCLPCDLTMETSILDVLKDYAEQIILKKRFEKMVSRYNEAPLRRPRSRTQTPMDSPVVLRRDRPQSMYVNEVEAEKIRNELKKMRDAEKTKVPTKKHSLFLSPNLYEENAVEGPHTGKTPEHIDNIRNEKKDYEEITIKVNELPVRVGRDSGVFEDEVCEAPVSFDGFMEEHERQSQERHFSVI